MQSDTHLHLLWAKLVTLAAFSRNYTLMTFDTVRQFLEHASGSGRRTTVISTLLVMGGLLIGGLIGGVLAGAADWILRSILILLFGDVALFGVAYVYFMLKSPDSLRSESFELEKMVIEKGFRGDSLQGEFKSEDIQDVKQLASDPPPRIEGPE